MSEIRLSRIERAILANQVSILGLLNKDNKDQYDEHLRILAEGFVREYPSVLSSVREDEIEVADCEEVIEILKMHSSLRFSFDRLADKGGVSEGDLKFQGFSGNEENRLMVYAEFVAERGSRFENIRPANGDYNSHLPFLPTYQRMLAVWRAFDQNALLSKEQILAVMDAKYPYKKK